MEVLLIDVSEYGRPGPLIRPSYLNSNVFYTPVEISLTPDLEAIAGRAAGILLNDGYLEEETVESVGLHIQAAAAFAVTAETQDDLQHKIIDTPGGPPYSLPLARGAITPSEAVSIASFLPYVAPYEFDVAQWLTRTMEITEAWETARPALRWLDLWHDKVSPGILEHLLSRGVEIAGPKGVDEVALYSGKLDKILEDKPETLNQLLHLIKLDRTLPLFGELGSETSYVEDVASRVNDGDVAHTENVRQVRHVNHFAGKCPDMDWWHNSTLFNTGPWDPKTHGDVVLVSVRDVLVGSITMHGESSMVALRSVEDERGKLPLVIGGVYIPRREVVTQAKAAFEDQGKWARMDLDDLAVRPLRFLNVEKPDDVANLGQTIADIKKVRQELTVRA